MVREKRCSFFSIKKEKGVVPIILLHPVLRTFCEDFHFVYKLINKWFCKTKNMARPLLDNCAYILLKKCKQNVQQNALIDLGSMVPKAQIVVRTHDATHGLRQLREAPWLHFAQQNAPINRLKIYKNLIIRSFKCLVLQEKDRFQIF